MVRMISAWTGTEMLVADDRVNEYLGIGHTLPQDNTKKPIEEPVKKVEPKKEEPKVETTKPVKINRKKK